MPRRWVLVMLFAVATIQPLTGLARADEAGTTDDPSGAAALLVRVNGERASNGLPPLTPRNDVTEIAQGHSRRMAGQRQIFHNDDYFTAATRDRLGASALGENVAFAGSVTDAHDELMQSPAHRANILDPRFTIAGFAVSSGADGLVYVTEDFAAVKATAAIAAEPAPASGPAPAPPQRAAPAPVTAPVSGPRAAPAVVTARPTTEAPTATTSPSTLSTVEHAAAIAAAAVDQPKLAVVGRSAVPPSAGALPSPMVASLLFGVDAGLLALALSVARRGGPRPTTPAAA
jgi:hypothetical protein